MGNTGCLPLAIHDTTLQRIIQLWGGLPLDVRNIVEAFCLQPALSDTRKENSATGQLELAELVTSWPEVPQSFRLAILTIVRMSSTRAFGPERR